MKELYKLIENYVPENVQEENDRKIMLKYSKKFDELLRSNRRAYEATL